jgi:dephospho-CoA kinase
VLVVDVDEETQISRVTARDRISREQALAILQSQASRQQRLALIADDIVRQRATGYQVLDTLIHIHRIVLPVNTR